MMTDQPLKKGSPTPRQNAQAVVSTAVAAHRIGNVELAAQLLENALEIDPYNPDALQLLGLLAKAKGDPVKAESLMRQSLKGNDYQPNVHHNLANLLRARGELAEALEHAEKACRLNQNYAEAQILLGELLMALGRVREAGIPLKKGHAAQPGNEAATAALADWHRKSGQPAESEKLLRAALRDQPGNVFFRNNLGLVLTEQMRYAEAVAILEPLAVERRGSAEIHVNVGNAMVGLGRLNDAVDHYFKAIQYDPLNYFAHTNANDILWQLGRKDDVGKSFVLAKRMLPNHPDVLEMSAECLIGLGLLEPAEADLLSASRLRPGTMAQYRLWTALKLAQGQYDEALHVAGVGLEHDPAEPDLLRKTAEACFFSGQPERALATARRMAANDPINQFAAAYEANAFRMLDNPEAARRLYDYERFVHEVDLPPPDGYGSLEEFHAVLTPALLALHHARDEPAHQTLRVGTQTHEDLFTRPGIHKSVVSLGKTILAAAEEFMAALPTDADHPFLRRKGKGMTWAGSWSVRLREGGYHIDHIHEKGWISGAYYVETPDCVADEQLKPGWIKFGAFQRAGGPDLSWEKAVRPAVGRLVLFPSYMTHGTLPTSGDQPRLTVSFDIVPKSA